MAEGNEFIENALTSLGELSAPDITQDKKLNELLRQLSAPEITKDKKLNELLRQLTELMAAREPAPEPAAEPAAEPAPESAPEPAPESGSRLLDSRLKPTKYPRVGRVKVGKLRPDFGFTWANKEEGDFTVRPYTMEEMKATAGDNQDLFGTGYDDGPPTADPEPEIPIEDSSNMDMANSEAEMTQPTQESRQDRLESSKKAFGTKSRDAMAESAEQDPEDYTDKAIEIFKDLHATEFDPKSRMDRGKLEKMKSMLAYEGGIGDSQADINKFALQFYRNS